ncbi:MAG: zinc-binding dehydrogenase [Aestuariibacter sp.]
MKFTAAVLVETNTPLELIDQIEVPVLKDGQVLVKLAYSGICHSQLMEAAGLRGPDRYLPHLLGHEGTGSVVDVGKGVSKVQAGDDVILGWLKGKGMESGGTRYHSPIGSINAGAVTTFNEYAVVSENRCYLLPKSIGLREGVLMGCAIPTGTGLIENEIKLTNHNSIAIIGLGGIGMSALLAAIQKKPKLVIAVDTNPEKLSLAKKLGADLCLNPATTSVYEAVSEATKGEMLDFSIEAAGTTQTIETAFSLLNSTNGLCVFASHPAKGDKIRLDPHELICGKNIRGSWGGNADPERIVNSIENGCDKYPFSALLSDDYSLVDINQAMNDLSKQRVLRAIVKIG